jgi:predicted RNA-binding protein (virulence factor B family)
MKGMSVSKWEMKKLFHVTVKEVYASIEADLIYASENLAALPSQKKKESCIGTFRKAYLYQDNFAKAATTLESVITAGNYSLVEITIRF